MNTTLLGIAAAAAVLALAACDSKPDGETAGQKLDRAIATTKTATDEAAENARRGLDQAAQATKEKSAEIAQKTEVLAEKAERKLERAGEQAERKLERAGRAAEEKTEGLGRKADDATITAAVKAGLAKDPDLSATRIDVDTHDGRVSLSGPAPSEAAKRRAQSIAQGADGVKAVDNRLTVAAR